MAKYDLDEEHVDQHHHDAQEDLRLLYRARIVAIGAVLVMLALIVFAITIGPMIDEDYAVSETLLIVVFPALLGSLLPLVGIKTIINKNGNGK